MISRKIFETHWLPGAGQGGGRVEGVGGAGLPGSIVSQGGGDLSDGEFYLSRIIIIWGYLW